MPAPVGARHRRKPWRPIRRILWQAKHPPGGSALIEVRPVDLEAAAERGLFAAGEHQIGRDHLIDQLGEADLGLPA